MNIFNAGRYSLKLNKTLVMGILNVTPDSFSDGGLYNKCEKAVKRAFEIQELGADILDIGAQSTRPGFTKISPDEEWKRLFPVLQKIKDKLDIPISIDTFYPEVAEKSLEFGASIINDVYGFENKKMFEIASKSDCGVVIMRNGSNMKIKNFFESKLEIAKKYNIDEKRICFDPGVGFTETREQDLFIINNIEKFRIKNIPILVGLSRKRVVSQYCESKDNYSKLPGTIALNAIAIARGANIIRVHDVKEAVVTAKAVDDVIKF